MIEHRYPKGNRLTLTLLESLGSSPDPAQIGAVLVSIYEQSGCLDCKAPYFVRGHVVTCVWAEPQARGFEGRIAHVGAAFHTLDAARAAARELLVQLDAARESMTVADPVGAS